MAYCIILQYILQWTKGTETKCFSIKSCTKAKRNIVYQSKVLNYDPKYNFDMSGIRMSNLIKTIEILLIFQGKNTVQLSRLNHELFFIFYKSHHETTQSSISKRFCYFMILLKRMHNTKIVHGLIGIFKKSKYLFKKGFST